MSILFESITIKNMELRNRFVRSATYDGSAEINGCVSERQMKLFTDLAEGGVGLIITGIVYTHPSGRISPFQNSLASDDVIPGFQKLTKAMHERGTGVAVQLFHAGREGAKLFNLMKEKAVAPSVVDDDPYFTGDYRALAEEEIWDIVHSFGDAAKRARAAGFDAVQIHGAHAYLISEFLSPFSNRRNDRWGGELTNRLRIHKEICNDIKAKAGDDYPVLIKLGVEDGFPGGLQFTEGLEAAGLCAEWGYDGLEISQGLRGEEFSGTEFRTKINKVEQEAYFRQWSKEVRKLVTVPVMMVGGLRTFELMEEVVQNGEADFVSLSRPFIREPGLVKSWENGSRRRATCISCNKCIGAMFRGVPLQCIYEKELAERAREKQAQPS